MKQNEIKIESIGIGLASPVRIRKWAEKILPNGKKIGEITTSKTVDYKTFKPEPRGLFCERIFGPIHDFECSCGKKKLKSQHQFCPDCDVEFTSSRVRRYRLGYIKLVSPVVHIWYLKGRPSFLSLLLDMKRKRIESIVYYTRSIYIPIRSFLKVTPPVSLESAPQQKNIITQKKPTYSSKFYTNKFLFVSRKAGFSEPKFNKNRCKFVIEKQDSYEVKCSESDTFNTPSLNKVILDQYYIDRFTNFLNKNKIFQTQVHGLFCNSYYPHSTILQFESLKNSQYNFDGYIHFIQPKFVLPKKRNKKTNEIVGQGSIPQNWFPTTQKQKKKIFLNSKFCREIPKPSFSELKLITTQRFNKPSFDKVNKINLKNISNKNKRVLFNSMYGITFSSTLSFIVPIIKECSPFVKMSSRLTMIQNHRKNTNAKQYKKNQYNRIEKGFFKPTKQIILNKIYIKNNASNKSSFFVKQKNLVSLHNLILSNLQIKIFYINLVKTKNTFHPSATLKGVPISESLINTLLNKQINEKNTNLFYFLNLPNSTKLDFIRQNGRYYFNKNQNHIKKDFSKLSQIAPFSVQPQPTMYYPIPLKCEWKSIWIDGIKVIDAIDKWKSILRYLTSNSTRYDIVLPFYFNKLSNQSLVINSTEYSLTPDLFTGTEAIWYLLKNINLPRLRIVLRDQLAPLDIQIKNLDQAPFLYKFERKKLRKLLKIRLKIRRRLKLVGYFQKSKLRPEWLLLSILPVLPPDLRPIIQLDGNQTAVSDLNHLYKRIIDRNKRIKNLSKDYSIHSPEMRYNRRLLQEAVDALIENGKGGTPLACAPNGRAFKSLSDILKGKKGRFRLNLLGKRVDYSGRSVIVVGPELKLHQCGLPKEMAIELFQPFIIRELRKNISETTIIKAKKLIQEQHPIIWKILQKILRSHPILLNRAPTLHRLGIQSFQAKLVEGRAILLHPLVCTAFNADFDGDQMAVHVPLSFQARAEAWKLMWSRNNILSPATGDPIIVPSQDMVLGWYYLTTNIHDDVSSYVFNNNSQLKQISIFSPFTKSKKQQNNASIKLYPSASSFSNLEIFDYFSNVDDVLIAFNQKKISIHSLIWVRWTNLIQIENFYERPLELRVDCSGNIIQVYSKYWRNFDKEFNQISQFIRTTPGRVLVNKTILEHTRILP